MERNITFSLKKSLAHLLVFFLKSLIFLQKIVGFVWNKILVKLMNLIGRFVFQFFIVRIYKIYLLAKSYLVFIYRPAKGKLLYLFSTRYIVHTLIILLAIIITTNNLSAQEISEEVISNSILASLVKVENEEMIIETAMSIEETPVGFMETAGSVVGKSMIDEETELAESTALTKEGAIVKPNIVATTLGDRSRDKVIYHEVLEGETVSQIAEQYGISTNTILWENKLGPRDFIKPGQQLTVLPASGVSYQVKSGDTLDRIAKQYEVDASTIVEYNKLASAEAISADQILLIPGGIPPAPPAPVVTPRSRFASFRDFFGASGSPDAMPDYGTKLQWPTTSHKINQYFRWRHTGIDIDGSYSSPIYAADIGRVEAVGWQGGYGLRVVINHGNGLKTLYGHLSKTSVRVGDSVSRGQTIGIMGCTGWCTGTHVHFEVFSGGRKVNPLSYL